MYTPLGAYQGKSTWKVNYIKKGRSYMIERHIFIMNIYGITSPPRPGNNIQTRPNKQHNGEMPNTSLAYTFWNFQWHTPMFFLLPPPPGHQVCNKDSYIISFSSLVQLIVSYNHMQAPIPFSQAARLLAPLTSYKCLYGHRKYSGYQIFILMMYLHVCTLYLREVSWETCVHYVSTRVFYIYMYNDI